MASISGLSGSISDIGGRLRLSGSYSGLDTAALVESLSDVKRIPADRLEARISENGLKTTAYQELNTLLEALRTAAGKLRSPPGTSGIASNIFETKAAFLSSNKSGIVPGEVLGVTAANGAEAGIYEFEVLQLAKAHKLSGSAVQVGGANVTSPSTALGLTDKLTIGLREGPLAGDTLGTTAEIDITATMSLADIAAAINAKKGETGVQASVLKVSEGEYRLVLTANETNKRIDIASTDPATMTALGGMAINTQDPQEARIRFDGTVITRNSNEISDLIPNVTLDLYKAVDTGPTDPTIITVEIENNIGEVKQALMDLVTAYNNVRDFVSSQQKAGEKGKDQNAILFGDDLVRTLGMELGNAVSGSLGLPNDVLGALQAVGITLDADNRLAMDTSKVDSLLVDKYDQLRAVFEFGMTASSDEVRMVGRTKAIGVSEFTLQFTGPNTASGAPTGVTVPGYGEVFDIVGNRLVGKKGTAFEGMTLAYSGVPSGTPADISIKITNGIAERLYQTADAYTMPDTGRIAERLTRIDDLNKRYDADIVRIDEQVARYREMLIQKFTAMERAMAEADAMTRQLKAMMGIKDE